MPILSVFIFVWICFDSISQISAAIEDATTGEMLCHVCMFDASDMACS